MHKTTDLILTNHRFCNASCWQLSQLPGNYPNRKFLRKCSRWSWMVIGSVIGAAIGGLFVGLFPVKALMTLLGVILLISATKTFKHTRQN
ncbi:sulfite exporter TauE/SafE family protein (plasmid) [Edwardsiella tarda]|uniref:sulfite exporter TauE/SafE family protein n=1 Tax=Edwardsiella tarda TaxID=636 RepID=UPI002443B6E9|nr:sulfite exporter TauE/SafE family protein [Edwardsiella tarda]WGE30913.1 sulfite exporter TauE/SafE family protein [Edwardsiella tarda]